MLNSKLIDFSKIKLIDYIDTLNLRVTTNAGGGFLITGIDENDIVLSVVITSTINGYVTPYKYYENNLWYGNVYDFNGTKQLNKSLDVRVYYIKA